MPAKKILCLDPFAGLSGDMFVGALLDLGLNLAVLEKELSKLAVSGYRLQHHRVMRGPLSAEKFDVLIPGASAESHTHEHSHGHRHDHGHDHGPHGHGHGHGEAHHHDHSPEDAHRTFAGIKTILKNSGLSARVKERSLKVFGELAKAEGRIHGQPPETVSFHEVGAIDSLVDIAGACIGLEALDIGEIWCGPVAVGAGGFVQCQHGTLPLPAPATLELLKGIPLRESTIAGELTTPTGAALVAGLASHFGPLPAMIIEKIGYGAGARERQQTPNVLRVLMGTLPETDDSARDTVLEIRSNADDSTPEVLGHLSERLLAAGALDVFFTPIQMKKSRPATLITILAEPAQLDTLAGILFSETSVFGLRCQTQSRLKLARRIETVKTPYGEVRVKVGTWQGRDVSVHPEYEDCRARAVEKSVPLKTVIEAARMGFGV